MFRLFTRDEAKPRKIDQSFELNGRKYKYSIATDNVHIVDSCTISKRDFGKVFKLLREKHPDCQVWQRSDGSLSREWAVHNACYDWNIRRSQTADVDLNYPQSFWEKLGYGVIGSIALIFIR